MVHSDGYQVTLTTECGPYKKEKEKKKGVHWSPNGPHADWQTVIGWLGIGFFVELISFNTWPISRSDLVVNDSIECPMNSSMIKID